MLLPRGWSAVPRRHRRYAYDPGGGHVSPGHNVTGTALDVVPGPGGSWDDVNRAVAWATSHGMTVYYDGRFGSTALENHGEGNHAHFEWAGADLEQDHGLRPTSRR